MATFGKLVFAVIVLVVGTIINAFVLQQLWQWFVASVFHVATLSIAQAVGLSMVVGYFKRGLKTDNWYDKYTGITWLAVALAVDIAYAVLTLVFGLIVKSFIQ